MVCADGQCALSCQAGLTACDGVCRDVETDRNNCGGCGMVCGSGEICVDGGCVLDCPPGFLACGGVCIDSKRDTTNCGSCGNNCSNGGEVCSNGVCSATCTGGETRCGNTCIDTTSDRNNCGACGVACPAGEGCNEGVCEPFAPCPEGTADNGGYCWVAAQDCDESPQEACARVGLLATPALLDLQWNNSRLGDVATQLGCSSLGDTGCCSAGMWRDPDTNTCYTHRFGNQFFNWNGCMNDDDPSVVTCLRRF